jgi:uncharacterized MAPEG superfamily protein
MTSELYWLLLTAMLAASLWIPYVVGVNTTAYDGENDNFVRPPDNRKLAAWVHRSYRAHLNLLEQFLPFATIVIVAHMLKVSTPITIWCTILFFWLRVAHAFGMITGLAGIRTRPVLFTAGWIVTLAMAVQVLIHAPSA